MIRVAMRVLGFSVVLIALIATSLPAAQSQPVAGRDTVIIGAQTEPDIFSLMFSVSPPLFAVEAVLTATFTQDVARDNDTWKVFPQGVEYLPDVKNGTWTVDGEKMRLLWKIKPRRWHDGRPVTCADYVFSHAVARDKRVGASGGQEVLTNRIASVSCPQGTDGLEIAVHWTERYGYANQVVIPYGALPRHVLEPFYRANPAAFRTVPFFNDPKATIGDGPYRLVEWRRGISLTVESIGDHPIFGTPKIRRITWRFFPDLQAVVASLFSGAVDAGGGFFFNAAQELERQAGSHVKVFWHPGLTWEHIDFNLDNPLLADMRIRRALAHGINRVQITQQLFGGRQPVSHTYLPPRHSGYTEAVEKYPYDPAKARRLLQEAGFAPGPDGVMHNAAGQRLQFEITTTAGVPTREQVELIIQQQLRQIGVEITILNFPSRVLFGEITARRKFKALAMYSWNFRPTSGCILYTSDNIPNEGNTWVGENYPGYRNTEMDRICKAISREIDEEKRDRLLNESAKLFARDLPALPLYYRLIPGVAKPGLRNFVFGIEPATWNAHRWYWE